MFDIYRLIEDGLSNGEIAKRFGVVSGNIYHIRHRKTWKRAYDEYINHQKESI